MTDSELGAVFQEIRIGNESAFSHLYEQMKIPLYTVIYRILNNRLLAEETLQEVFVKFYREPPSPDIQKLRAWMFRVAHNTAIDTLRRERKQSCNLISADFQQKDGDDFILTLTIEDALQKLTDQEREIITMHLNCGLKFREISEILGRPQGTVLWLYYQGLEQLRNFLSEG